MDWKTCLETIFKMEQCPLEQETYGLYGVTITDKDVGLVIDVNEAKAALAEAQSAASAAADDAAKAEAQIAVEVAEEIVKACA